MNPVATAERMRCGTHQRYPVASLARARSFHVQNVSPVAELGTSFGQRQIGRFMGSHNSEKVEPLIYENER